MGTTRNVIFLLLASTMMSWKLGFAFLPLIHHHHHHHPAATRKSIQTTQLSLAWQSHVSTHHDGPSALQKVLEQVGTNPPDIAFLFVGGAHTDDFSHLVEMATQHFGPTTRLISLIAGGVIGENVEIDEPRRPSLSLMTGTLPQGADVEVFSWSPPLKGGEETQLSETQTNGDSYLVFGDPWSSVENLVKQLSSSASSPVIAGGISCPANLDAKSSLAINDKPLKPGSAIAVKLSGSVGLQTLVAQGCRPIGKAYTITEGEGNIIESLDGEPALDVLQNLAVSASEEERELIANELLCGIGLKSDGQTTDYLSRQMVGFVPAIKGFAVAGKVQVGDTFCFQVRDKASAEKDMELMIQRAKTARLFYNNDARSKGKPMGALQISCVARGRGLFGVPNVDLTQVKGLVDDQNLPVAGFFANGEIGPVGIAGFTCDQKNSDAYIHGFTTVVAVFCDFNDHQQQGSESSTRGEMNFADFDDAWG